MPISFEPLPLVIGVTGHRDLRQTDIPRLTREIKGTFERLEDEYLTPPSPLERALQRFWPWAADRLKLEERRRERSGETPMIVLSALAEGADQLVAQVAIDRGMRVIAPLPLPEQEYRRDFEANPVRPDALRRFERWMNPQPRLYKLFVGYEAGVSSNNVTIPENRALQYRRAGTFIVRHCDVLIALWDGEARGEIGGTAEVIDFKRHGIPLEISRSGRKSLDAPEIGPVIHIVTPRATKTPTAGEVRVQPWGGNGIRRKESAFARQRFSAANEQTRAQRYNYMLWRFFQASVRQTCEYNRVAVDLLNSPAGAKLGNRSLMDLLGNATLAREDARPYCDLYAVADTLAQLWQRIFRRVWGWLFALGLLAFACFQAYIDLTPIIAHRWQDVQIFGNVGLAWAVGCMLLSGYFLACGGIVVLVYAARLRKHQGRFVGYRAFAEALRVAVFWRLAGIDDAVADHYPIKMPQELAWVKNRLLALELLDKADPERTAAAQATSPPDYRWLRRTWVENQRAYFGSSRLIHLRNAEWRERWSKRLLFAIVALAALLLVLMPHVADNPADEQVPRWLSSGEWRSLIAYVVGFLPAVATCFVGYSEKLALKAQARHYHRMRAVFGEASYAMERAARENTDLTRDVMRELGIEAMRENLEWASMFQQRPIGPTQPM